MRKYLRKMILGIIIISTIAMNGCGSEGQTVKIENPDTTISEESVADENKSIFVYVSGEVSKQGVYELRDGARVFEAIEAAGGFSKKADKSGVNLALETSDGQHIIVPSINSGNYTGGAVNETAQQNVLININTADKNLLMTLTGIGEAKANSIISYREENGAFNTIEDIMQVSGIGDAVFSKIKDKITVK